MTTRWWYETDCIHWNVHICQTELLSDPRRSLSLNPSSAPSRHPSTTDPLLSSFFTIIVTFEIIVLCVVTDMIVRSFLSCHPSWRGRILRPSGLLLDGNLLQGWNSHCTKLTLVQHTLDTMKTHTRRILENCHCSVWLSACLSFRYINEHKQCIRDNTGHFKQHMKAAPQPGVCLSRRQLYESVSQLHDIISPAVHPLLSVSPVLHLPAGDIVMLHLFIFFYKDPQEYKKDTQRDRLVAALSLFDMFSCQSSNGRGGICINKSHIAYIRTVSSSVFLGRTCLGAQCSFVSHFVLHSFLFWFSLVSLPLLFMGKFLWQANRGEGANTVTVVPTRTVQASA